MDSSPQIPPMETVSELQSMTAGLTATDHPPQFDV
jgi:hypothetical protein